MNFKVSKEKLVMSITIGIACVALMAVMFMQFKVVKQTDITAIETMRETELRSELASWKEKYEEIETKLAEVDGKITEYRKELDENANSSTVLQEEVKEAETYLGYTSLQGQGIIVTLKDREQKVVNYSHILQLVNELNAAGAEAISVNDERIVSMSEIVTVKDKIVTINERKVAGPFIVKAIGDKKYFESALSIKGGYMDLMKAAEIDVTYTVEDNIVVPAFEGEQKFEYAKEYIEKDKEE